MPLPLKMDKQSGRADRNAISRKHTLDQLLEEIGEPVYRYQRKESVQEGF